MSYVWSNTATVTILPDIRVTSVTLNKVDPQTAKVGQAVSVYATAQLSSAFPGGSGCVEFVLKANDRIVQTTFRRPATGATSVDEQIVVIFTQPGTYTLMVGAKYNDYCNITPR